MKPLAFNLKNVKKVAMDKHSSTFTTKDGHKIIVAHTKLSPENLKAISKMPLYMEDGGQPEAPESGGTTMQASDQTQQDYTVQTPQVADNANPVENPNVDVSTQPAQAVGSPKGFAPTGALPSLNLNDVYTSGVQAQKDFAAAQGKLANDQAAVEKQNQADLQQHQNNWNIQNAQMQSEVQSALDDIEQNHINTDHYMQSRTDTQKVNTAIGLFLGGLSTSFRGGPNPAMDFLNKQIDRDIEGQKAEADRRMNVFRAYNDKFKNAQAADQMARAVQLGIYASKIREAADKSGSPLAQARANIAISGIQQNMLANVNNAHLLNAVDKFSGVGGHGAGGGSEAQFQTILSGAQRVNPQVYKDLQEKYVPGVGVASRPVVHEDLKRLTDLNVLMPLIDRSIADQENFGKTGAWSVKNRADAESDRNALQVRLNELTGLNRLNDHEYKNYASQIGNIGGVNLGGTLQTLKNLKHQAETDRNSFIHAMGVKPFTDAQAPSGLSPQQQNNLNTFMKNNPGIEQGNAIKLLRSKGLI